MSESTVTLVERRDRGSIRHAATVYGASREGIPLHVYMPKSGRPEILVLAAIHGDESETNIVLSDALRSVREDDLKNAVILCANPDGMIRGTRGNAIGVDVNRNFPTSNWSPDPVYYKILKSDPQDIALSTGTEPASEPETKALIALWEKLQPRAIVSLHSALACVDDPDASVLGNDLAEKSGLPLQADIGYPTPGSMGSWAIEKKLNLVTYELEAASPYDLKVRHTPVMIDLLTGNVELG